MSVIHLHQHQEPIEPQTARELTDSIKADVEALWTKLLTAYERKAHEMLGYPSWHVYCKAEFGTGKSQSYRLLDAARVAKAIEAHSPMGERPTTERVARELTPTLKEGGEEAVAQVWEQAVDEHGPNPTAEEVEEVARAMGTHKPKAKPKLKLNPSQKKFLNAMNALELGAEYVQAELAGRSQSEQAHRRELLGVDDETWAEWQRQATVVYLAGSQLRRNFTRKGGRRP